MSDSPKPPPKNAGEAFAHIRQHGKELGDKLREQLKPVKEQLHEVGDRVREGMGFAPKHKRFHISRVLEQPHTRHIDDGDPTFDTLDEAIAYCVSASRGWPERFEIVTKDQAGTWVPVKSVFQGAVSDPKL